MNSNGSGIVSVLIISTVLSTVGLGLISRYSQLEKSVKRVNHHISAGIIREQFNTMVKNDTSWENTYNDVTNPTLACIKNSTNCFALAGADSPIVVIRDVEDVVLFDDSDAANGISVAGEPCDSFEEDMDNPGSGGCPFSLTMTWRPICPADPCIDPQVKINFSLLFHDNIGTPFNTGRYSFALYR